MNVVLHLLDLSIIGKYLSTKYFVNFGVNHPYYEMKQEPHIRRELVVGLLCVCYCRKCSMNVCIDRMGTVYLMFNREIDWKKSIKSYVIRNRYLAISTSIRLYHDVENSLYYRVFVCISLFGGDDKGNSKIYFYSKD